MHATNANISFAGTLIIISVIISLAPLLQVSGATLSAILSEKAMVPTVTGSTWLRSFFGIGLMLGTYAGAQMYA